MTKYKSSYENLSVHKKIQDIVRNYINSWENTIIHKEYIKILTETWELMRKYKKL